MLSSLVLLLLLLSRFSRVRLCATPETAAHQALLSLVAQAVKRVPAIQETRVRCLGREDPLEKEMAIHSSALAWKIPWTEEPGRLQFYQGSKESDTTEQLHFSSNKW